MSRSAKVGRAHGSVTAIFATVLVLVALYGCERSPEQPNIVLITVDTLRADRLAPYGYDKVETAAITRLAGEGILYERAFADTPWTLPSLSSVLTGKYPTRHKVRSWNDRLGAGQLTIAEILKERGYATAAVVGSYPLDRYFGLAQGFDHYDDEMSIALYEGTPPKFAAPSARTDQPADDSRQARESWQAQRETHNAYRTDREVADKAIEWLEANRDTPFFLWVHFFGPHEKGKRADLPPEELAEHIAQQVARYDGDVEDTDRQVGRFLDALRGDRRFPFTAVILHSDHGQSLNEHGIFGHGFDLFDTTVHVPLIIRLPAGQRAGTRVPHLVRNLDIFATVLELTRAPAETWDSRSLLQQSPPDENHAYMETHNLMGLTERDVDTGGATRRVGTVLRGVRNQRRKLIAHVPELVMDENRGLPLPAEVAEEQTLLYLYESEQDRNEYRNFAEQRPNQTRQLRALLERHVDVPDIEATSPDDLDDAAKERLRSLGYQP